MKSELRGPFAGIVVLLLVLGGARVAVAQGNDLSTVVQEALLSNPDVAEARNQWLARREEVRQAEGGFLPSLDLNAGIGYEYTDSPTTRAGSRGSNQLERKELGLNIRQMLFDGWGTESEVLRQQARTDAAAARLLAVGQSTALKAAQAYVDLQRYRELRDISAESLNIHKRIQDQIRLRSEAGVGRRADYEQVNSRVALAEVNLLAAEVNLEDARTTFQRVVGTMPSGSYGSARPATEALPDSLQRVLEIAQANNPVLHTATADIEAARAQHEASRQFDYPRFDLELGGNLNDNLSGTEGHADDMAAMIRMRYNLFRGGSDAARQRATRYNVDEARSIRDRSMRQLEESVRLSWAAFEVTKAQLPLLESQVASARATRDAYEKQFNIGQRTLLDVLNSENEVTQARQSVVGAAADHLLAQYRLLEAMGSLIDHLGVGAAVAQGGN